MNTEERRLPPRFVPTLTEVLPPEPQAGGLDLELPLGTWDGPAPVVPPTEALPWAGVPMAPEPVVAAPEPVPTPEALSPQARQALVQEVVERVMRSVEAELPEALEQALAQVRERLAAAAWAALLELPEAGAAPATAPGPGEGGFEQAR
jgi:hypothetical protein